MEYVAQNPVGVVAEPGLVWKPEPQGRILLVDDDDTVRAIAAELLRDAGYVVREAGSAEEALRQIEGEAGRWDLLVTDMDMPGMNGVQLAGHLQARLAGLKVLVISGRDPQEFRPALPAATPFLGKPFSMAAFMARVKELLAQP